MRIVESSGGIISGLDQRGDRYLLLITTPRGLLSIPKGHIESGETAEIGAIREMKEEVGLEHVQIIKKLGTVSRIGTEHDGSKKEKLIHVFLMDGRGFTFDHEEDYVWIEWNQAIDLMHYEEEKDFLINNRSEIEESASELYEEHMRLFGGYKKDYLARTDEDGLIGILDKSISESGPKASIMILGAVQEEFNRYSDKVSYILIFDDTDMQTEEAERAYTHDNVSYKRVSPINIINSDLPEKIDVFYSRNGLNLSDMKCFFLINEVLKKMPVGGYFLIEGIASADVKYDRTKIGPNLFIDGLGTIRRIWDEKYIGSIAERLKLEIIESKRMKDDSGEEKLIFAYKKVNDYFY